MLNRQSYTMRFRAFVTTLSNKYEQLRSIDTKWDSKREEYEDLISAAPERFQRNLIGKMNESKTNKRTYEESFGVREYDNERYGQEIPDNFFKQNIGHGTYE